MNEIRGSMILLALASLLASRTYAQEREQAPWEPEWVRTWGPGHDFPARILGLENMGRNKAWDVVVHDGRLHVTGNDQARERGDIDLFVRTYDADGTLLWDQTWDGGAQDAGFAIAADGGAGAEESFIYVGGFTRADDRNKALLQKRRADDGSIVWTKTWGEIERGHHEVDGIAIVGGALYVSHWDATFGFRTSNAVLLKFSKRQLDETKGECAPLWRTQWGEPDAEQDTADGHIVADESGVWVTGRIGGHAFTGPKADGDLYLTKIDPDGRQLWTKIWGGRGYDQGLNLTTDGERIYVAGWAHTETTGTLDAVVAVFDVEGSLVGTKLLGASGSVDLARGIAVDADHIHVAVQRTPPFRPRDSTTSIVTLSKATLQEVHSAVWHGAGGDQVSASLREEGRWLYLAGSTRRFTEGEGWQPVLMKVSKEAGDK